MTQKKFGSADSTGRKLDVIQSYLEMYQKALSQTGFATLYIDGFAGSGEVPTSEHKENLFDEDVRVVMAGSATRALAVHPPFTRYIFIDKSKRCIDALQNKFKADFPKQEIKFEVGDANDKVRAICRSNNWRAQRGVILLDPFGSQVEWATIEEIANTKALDLWYLFPAGVSVFRQISNKGTVDGTHVDSITRLFGTDAWKTAFIQHSTECDLFGAVNQPEKNVTPESAAKFMIERMKTVFKGGVLEVMIPLGKHHYPSFYLLFAWSNPSERAKALANKLSRAAIRATDRKHGRLV